jgi:ribonucleotide reductase beta subunit family protein with ferritin-like domain
MAFVWEKLDGNTTLSSINKEIKKIVRDENIHLSQLTQFLVEEMEKVDLVKSNDI